MGLGLCGEPPLGQHICPEGELIHGREVPEPNAIRFWHKKPNPFKRVVIQHSHVPISLRKSAVFLTLGVILNFFQGYLAETESNNPTQTSSHIKGMRDNGFSDVLWSVITEKTGFGEPDDNAVKAQWR